MTDRPEGTGEHSDHWTEPDRSEERWLQPWEEQYGQAFAPFWVHFAGPMWQMAARAEWEMDFFGEHDFFTPRARWVSDR